MGMRYAASLFTAWALYACTIEFRKTVSVDCALDKGQYTSEMEGGFETGTVAGVAAGGAAVTALVGGASLGGRDDGGGSGGGSSSKTTPSTLTTAKVGILLDSVVAGVSFETSWPDWADQCQR